jgi:translation initiation factor 4A
MNSIGEYMNISVYLCIGGRSVDEDKRNLQKGPQIVIGTPGRVLHLISSNSLRKSKTSVAFCNFLILATSAIKIFVIDEADELLSSGFKEQIHDIFQKMPKNVQAVLLSATMPSEALEITEHFMHNPVRILIKKEAV